MSIWELAEKTQRKMEKQGKGIFVTFDGQGYFIREMYAEHKDIALLKVDSPQFGHLKDEVVCDSYALRGTEDPKEIHHLLHLLTNKECYEEFRYVEIEDSDNDDENSTFLAIPVNDPLPPNATGRFLKFNFDTCEFYFV